MRKTMTAAEKLIARFKDSTEEEIYDQWRTFRRLMIAMLKERITFAETWPQDHPVPDTARWNAYINASKDALKKFRATDRARRLFEDKCKALDATWDKLVSAIEAHASIDNEMLVKSGIEPSPFSKEWDKDQIEAWRSDMFERTQPLVGKPVPEHLRESYWKASNDLELWLEINRDTSIAAGLYGEDFKKARDAHRAALQEANAILDENVKLIEESRAIDNVIKLTLIWPSDCPN